MLFAELYERKGIVLFSLGDHAHFRIPVWRDFLSRFGTVDGTRENCARLMQEGEAVLVFPGGGREVAKRKGERYRLIWKDRLGFVRLAAEHGCTIVPFASVGVEDAFEIVIDADQILASPLGKLIDRLGIRRDVILPLSRLKRPGRIYLGFAPPIAAAGIDAEDPTALRDLRDRVRSAVEGEIASLRALRASSAGARAR